ncbi:hypothetical protein IJI55_00860 [Candidatus Saccharibacteria bacterium]|nr:hypothetical protein [Candidatus Saccharibacteria bacterium]
MPTITDYFNKAADNSGSYPATSTVSATRNTGEQVLSCQDLTGWATDTPVHFTTYRLGQDGSINTTTQTDWKGIVVGNTITQLTRIAGAADSGHAIGDIVELNPTIGWLSDLVTGLLAIHNQDGTLKDGIVASNKLASSAVTKEKLAAAAVATDKIDWESLGDQSSYLEFGDILIQWGKTTGVRADTSKSVTLPKSFKDANYILTTSFQYNEQSNSCWIAFPCAKNTGSFTVRGGYKPDTGNEFVTNTNAVLNWIAIGVKASQ